MSGEYGDAVVTDLHRMVEQGLSRWGLSPETRISLLNLSENATFGLEDPAAGRRLALRLHRIGYSSIEEIRSELAWIHALHRDRVVETALPVPGADGDAVQTLRSPGGFPERQAVAFEWLSGIQPAPSADLGAWFEMLGSLTARMHRHAKDWARPPGFRRKRWDIEAMVGPNAFWGPWRAGIGLDREGIAVIERALDAIGSRIEHFGIGPDRFGLVHADLRLANLLVEGEHLRVIDFDDCGLSWFVYDFAAAISFIEHEPIVPALERAWVRGYRKAATLSAEDEAEIPTFVMLRRILLTAWLASHAEIPFAREIGEGYGAGTVRLARAFLAGRLLRSETD
jgi:Ser/Thr protein kinase RdoA (MazF antagonist)